MSNSNNDPVLPKGIRRIAIPAEFQSQRLVTGKVFYTLPAELLRILESGKTREFLTREILDLEHSLGAISQDHTIHVGFWRGLPIRYLLLYDHRYTNPDDLTKGRRVPDSFAEHHRSARAYAGWLLANARFIQEHDEFFQRWRLQLQRYGFPLYIARTDSFHYLEEDGNREGELKKEYAGFLKRWQLTALASPYLPEPIMTHEVLFSHGLTTNPLRGQVMGISVPSIAPLPEAEALRKKLEEGSGRLSGPKHLVGWIEIVKNTNRQRNHKLIRYERIFRLVHFWRVVHQRHSSLEQVSLESRRGVFSQFFNVSEASIRADLEFIQHARGRGWHLRDI